MVYRCVILCVGTENISVLSYPRRRGNVNTTVSEFLNSLKTPIKHMIAQKTVVFSNSMIEALNKVIKHQYLYSESLSGIIDLKLALTKAVNSYNTVRPHWSLGGNTPLETYTGGSVI